VAEQKPPTKRKGCLGCSFPIVIILAVLTIIGLLAGGVVPKVLSQVGVNLNLPSIMSVPAPLVELPPEAIFHIGPMPITNTLITTWIGMLVIALVFILLSKRKKIIPSKFQSAMELILEWVLNLCKDVVGEKNGPKFFPIIVTIFLFVLVNALMAQIPGMGSILISAEDKMVPLFRNGNTDINTPFAIAIVSLIFVESLGFATVGFKYIKKFVNLGRLGRGFADLFKGKAKSGMGGIGYGIIDAFVGFLEFISEIFRLVSFTFRLFGNMTGGEILILTMMFLGSYVLVVPFSGLEILFGTVQALIFSALTLVFASVAMESHDEHL